MEAEFEKKEREEEEGELGEENEDEAEEEGEWENAAAALITDDHAQTEQFKSLSSILPPTSLPSLPPPLQLLPKKKYRPSFKIEAFLSSSNVSLGLNGPLMACPYDEEVKVVDVMDGKVVRTLFFGEGERVVSVTLSPDRVSVFACGSRSLLCKWWDITTGKCKRTWKAHESPTLCMRVDSSGGLLATGSADSCVRIWDVEGGFATHSFKGQHKAGITKVEFFSSSVQKQRTMLLSSSEDCEIRMWDLSSRSCCAVFKNHLSSVTSFSFADETPSYLRKPANERAHSAPSFCVSASRDKVVSVWSLSSKTLVSTVPAFESLEGVCSLPFTAPFFSRSPLISPSSPDDFSAKRLSLEFVNTLVFATVGEKGVLKIWTSKSGECLCAFDVLHISDTQNKKKSEGEQGSTSTVSLTSLSLLSDPHTADKLKATKADNTTSAPLLSWVVLATSSDFRLLFLEVSARMEQQAEKPAEERGKRLRGEKTGEVRARADKAVGLKFDVRLLREIVGNNDEVIDVKFFRGAALEGERREGEGLGGKEGEEGGTESLDHEGNDNEGEGTDEECTVAVATNSEQIRLFDLRSSECIRTFTGHSDIVLSIDTCQTMIGVKKKDVLASAGKDNTVRVWDVATGCCIGFSSSHAASVTCVAFATSTATERTKDVGENRQKKRRKGEREGEKERRGLCHLLSGSSDRTLKVWDLKPLTHALLQLLAPSPSSSSPHSLSPTPLRSLSTVSAHDRDINCVCASPNGEYACSGSQDRTAKVWKLPELSLVFTLRGHKRGIFCTEFSPVDKCVLTASADKTIRLWSLSDGSCLRTLEGHLGNVLRASFLTRGTQVVSSGSDGLLKLWNIRTSECVNTFDVHQGKIWALAVSPKKERLVTGGSDALVVAWDDVTRQEEVEETKRKESLVLQDQELSNALLRRNFLEASRLAFKLKKPYRLLGILEQIYSEEDADAKVSSLLRSVLSKEKKRDKERDGENEVEPKGNSDLSSELTSSSLPSSSLDEETLLSSSSSSSCSLFFSPDPSRLSLLLSFLREWNSNSRCCHVAQRVLKEIMRSTSTEEIARIPGIVELLSGLQAYSLRHFQRLQRLQQHAFCLDYVLASSSLEFLGDLDQGGEEKQAGKKSSKKRRSRPSKAQGTQV